MSPTYSPVQINSLLKSFVIFFIIQAGIVIVFFPSIWSLDISYRLLMLSINIGLSAVLGWQLYKKRYRLIFSYNDNGFKLKQGSQEEISHEWGEFSKVSLSRNEQGDFIIRLENSNSFDILVSKLKLNPYDFRTEATRLVQASQKRKSH
ncbi:hypothetical protein HXY33_00455 [Candidatus Bathyarchaeota archaeon]|nr:hypothetical protein [Candidatus Bathyarchaeota archaeon]